MARTPQFVRWSLPLACALREDTDVTDPEQTERQLRSLLTYSECVARGREYEGVCVSEEDPSRGFVSEEVLLAYGGREFVAQLCPTCPSNILRERPNSNLAGCFGMLVLDEALTSALNQLLQEEELEQQVAKHFLATTPAHWGLWTSEALNETQMMVLHSALSALAVRSEHCEVTELLTALSLARACASAIHFRLYPAGESDAHAWRLDPHCRRCKATMPERGRFCSICRLEAHAEPSRRRKVRGGRPYVPLATFLGESGAQAFRAKHGLT